MAMPSSDPNNPGSWYVGAPQASAQGYNTATRGYQDLLASNYTKSGLEGVANTPQASATYGMVPQDTMDQYYNQAGDYAYGKAKAEGNANFGDHGYAALGNGAQVWGNTDAAKQIGIARAGANVQNAQHGVQAQDQFNQSNLNRQTQIGTNYFQQLNNPLESYYRSMMGGGMSGGSGGAQVHTPTTGGSGSSGGSSTPWWQTSYGAMPAATSPEQQTYRDVNQPQGVGGNVGSANPYQSLSPGASPNTNYWQNPTQTQAQANPYYAIGGFNPQGNQ